MIDFSKVTGLSTSRGAVVKAALGGKVFYRRIDMGFVSLGDSIAAGHTINSDWAANYGEGSQYGVNGNTETVIVPGSYTAWIRDELTERYGAHAVFVKSFARSGDTVADLIDKLSHTPVRYALQRADVVTICIGANDVLEPAMSNLGEYINTGSVAAIEAAVEANLAILADPENDASYSALLRKLTEISPEAQYVFTAVYNPYKYLWIDPGQDGFFRPLLDTIPDMTILGFTIDDLIKEGLLSTSAVQMLFDRVNGLGAHSEKYVTRLNAVLRDTIAEHRTHYPNFIMADTKALYDTFPDRPVSAQKHYNDLVNVEYTSGYDTMQMDWGQLYEGSSAAAYWTGLATDYVSLSGFDIEGLATELVADVVDKVIVPDVDPHPEEYGQYVLYRSFADALGWRTLDRYTISYNANGGSGTMPDQTVVGVDGLPAYVVLAAPEFIPATGYHFTGWNTAADGSGVGYSAGQQIGLTANLVLYAQWSNICEVIYKHTNDTDGLYGDDETGHMECYALYINGELKPKFGTFAEGSETSYAVPYGATIRVVVSNYNPSEVLYDDVDCDVYYNGVNVASGYRGTEYTFTLTGSVTIDFRWKIAGSLVTFDAKSWEDCYITDN